MGLNMIFNGMTSTDGFQPGMLKRIEQSLPIDQCILVDCCNDGSDKYDERYRKVSYDVCAHCKYAEDYDLESMKSVDKATMMGMQYYEAMAIKMLMRMYEVSFFTYDEAKRMYLQHVRFWNHMIETYDINYIVITAVPHHTHQYLLYALARVKHIPLCVLTVCQIATRRIACDDLDAIGVPITRDYYDKWKGRKDADLPCDIEEFYQRKKYKNINTGQTSMMTAQEKNTMVKVIQSVFYQDVSRERLMKAVKKALKSILTSDKSDRRDRWRSGWHDVSMLRRARKKMRQMVSVDYFDHMAVVPELGISYVAYFLHYQPEATTMPQAGVFVEQEQAIRILAESLEGTGIRLYVKEHFVQQKREREFYNELRKIRNVVLIRSDVGTKEIIMNSLAVATCTGTVTLEAVINGIPSLVFGKVGLDDGPGIYPVASASDCREVLQKIQQSGYEIDQNEVRNYLNAFGDHTFRAYTGSKATEVTGLTMQQSSDNTADAIVNFYQEIKRNENG